MIVSHPTWRYVARYPRAVVFVAEVINRYGVLIGGIRTPFGPKSYRVRLFTGEVITVPAWWVLT
jgi:hypothetical protein